MQTVVYRFAARATLESFETCDSVCHLGSVSYVFSNALSSIANGFSRTEIPSLEKLRRAGGGGEGGTVKFLVGFYTVNSILYGQQKQKHGNIN